MGHWIIRI